MAFGELHGARLVLRPRCGTRSPSRPPTAARSRPTFPAQRGGRRGHRRRSDVGCPDLVEATALIQVPPAQRLVLAARRGVVAVGAERHVVDLCGVAGEGVQASAGGQDPRTHGAGSAAGHGALPVGGDRHRGHRVGVIGQDAHRSVVRSHQRTVASSPPERPRKGALADRESYLPKPWADDCAFPRCAHPASGPPPPSPTRPRPWCCERSSSAILGSTSRRDGDRSPPVMI
jgi:hypothetical protein